MRLPLFLLLAGFTAVSTGAETKPNFTGVWKLAGDHPVSMIVQQTESELRVFQFVKDNLVMVHGPIDGQSHTETAPAHTETAPAGISDQPYQFLARWEGQSLFYLIDTGLINTGPGRLMSLSIDGKTMTLKSEHTEKWERQDPPPQEDLLTPFDARAKLDAPEADNYLRGWMAHAFNDVPAAERELLPLINRKPTSKFRDEARTLLAEIYHRNGMVTKALPYWGFADRHFFYQKLAKYPEISVAHRGYAHIHATRDSDGRSRLPLTIAGKDAGYEVDTGAGVSLLSRSEAKRLGLKLESLHRTLMNGIVKFDVPLTIVPSLTIGETRLENVPFWVMPDGRVDDAGILGIDLLMQLQTLRWNPGDDVEIGFPPQAKDIRKANLCFWDHDLMLDVTSQDVSSKSRDNMIFFLDMGAAATELYPRFATRNFDLLSVNATRSTETLDALGGHREFLELTLPEAALGIDGSVVNKHPAGMLLETPNLHNRVHGVIGMDVLQAVPHLTLDFRAMRLTLGPPD